MTAARLPLDNRTLGDFTVGAKLGEGGYGVVYRAEQRTLGRPAVVKVLHARHGTNEAVVQRFLREAQLASRLDHPYAAHIYAFGAEPDGLLWIAMELVRGTTLRKVLEAQPGGRLPLARLVPLLDGLCEVVHTAHEQGIVHRDLKPDNVMVLSRAGRLLPKLLDLGIAKLVTDAAPTVAPRLPDRAADPMGATLAPAALPPDAYTPLPSPTEHGALIGSPHYMAPEQWIEGGTIDPRTDQYALGIVTYELLAGELPFIGRSIPDIARGHLRGELEWPDDLPPALGDVLRRACAKQPDDRFPSVLAFAAAVREAAGLRLLPDALPRLPDELRAEAAWYPQPLADAVAALEAARNPHQARDALWEIVSVIARWLGCLALCARARTPRSDAPAVTELLRELHRRELADDEWLALARALAAPFAELRDAYPIPELVDLLRSEPSPFEPLFALRAAEGATTTEESLRDRLARTLPVLAPLLGAIGFVTSYQLVVPREDGRAEVWMGSRRSVIAVGPGLTPGEPALVDLDGQPVLQLAPLVQLAAPAPGAPDELFVFAGPGRLRGHGARLVAEPHGLERHDDAVWAWFRANLIGVTDDAHAELEHAPYRGLAAFTEADAELFFGRERAVEAFVNQLHTQPLLAVVGPSGTGKSSFVRAGVIPSLPAGWRTIVMRPGAKPRLDVPPGTQVVVVDQLEELFTLCLDPAERERFAAQLAQLDIRVIVTIRDDFLARAAELAPLRDRLARAVTLLATPAPDDLLRVITEPARRAGYDLDDGLAQQIVRSVAGRPGALALLSFTALQLWDLRDRHFKRLTQKAYDAIGGVEGALAQHAEETLRAMTAEEQRLVREAFRHLVTAEGTRAVLSRKELADVLGSSTVIDKLADARLLVIAEADDGERVEIIHEALLSAWPRLVEWRRDDAEGARLRDQLRAAAKQWDERGRPRGLLWRDEALDEYTRWRSRWPGALPELDKSFGEASVRDAARGKRIVRAIAGTVAAVILASVVALAFLYRSSKHNATDAHDRLIASYIDQGQHYLLDNKYLEALPYLAAAYADGDRSTALRFMLHRARVLASQPVLRPEHHVTEAMFRGNTSQVFVLGEDSSAVLWDHAADRIVASLPPPTKPGQVYGAVSPIGDLVALPRANGVLLWDGAVARTIPVANVQRVAFDAAGRRLAIGTSSDVSSYDVATLAQLSRTPIEKRTRQLIWSKDSVALIDADYNAALLVDGQLRPLGPATRLMPQGDRFAVVTGDTARVLDSAGALVQTFDGVQVRTIALSHDGALVAMGLLGGAITLHDGTTGRELGQLAGHTDEVRRIAITRDGRRLISASNDQTVRVWDVAHRKELVRYEVAADIFQLHLGPDDRHVVVSTGTNVYVLPVDDPATVIAFDSGEGAPSARWAADGRIVIGHHAVTLWDGVTGQRVAQVGQRIAQVSGDDQIWSAADDDATLAALSDATGTLELRALPDSAMRATARIGMPVGAIRFAHHSPWFVIGSSSDESPLVELWSTTGQRLATLYRHRSGVRSVDVALDDHLILTASNDNTAQIWDIARQRVVQVARHNDEVSDAEFDATGRHFVTAGGDGGVMQWDVGWPWPRHRYRSLGHPMATAMASDLVAVGLDSDIVAVWDTSEIQVGAFHHANPVLSTEMRDKRLLAADRSGVVIVWDIALENDPPPSVTAFVECHVPFALRDTQLIAVVPRRCVP